MFRPSITEMSVTCVPPKRYHTLTTIKLSTAARHMYSHYHTFCKSGSIWTNTKPFAQPKQQPKTAGSVGKRDGRIDSPNCGAWSPLHRKMR